MRRRLYVSAQVCVLVLLGLLVGYAARGGEFFTMLGGGAPAAEASALDIEPQAPLALTGSGFTYQGRLTSGGNPATGQYDFQFSLYSDVVTTTLVSTPVTLTNQTVTNGLFTVTLDFGSSAFDGNARYLQLSVRPASTGSYTLLSPRQPITPAPYALFATSTTPYKYVVTVAQSGGQFTSITAALNSITDNSAVNRYLVKIAPGVYTETVTMKQHVDIEGSGVKNTKITSPGSSAPNTGTVIGSDASELRFLTVENTGSPMGFYAIAIYNNSASPSLLNITAKATGTAVSSINYGMYNINSSPNLNDSTVTAEGGGSTNKAIYFSGGALEIRGSTIRASSGASVGIDASSASVTTIDSSTITATTNTISTSGGATVFVGASQLDGGPVTGSGITCTASYNEGYVSPGLNVCP